MSTINEHHKLVPKNRTKKDYPVNAPGLQYCGWILICLREFSCHIYTPRKTQGQTNPGQLEDWIVKKLVSYACNQKSWKKTQFEIWSDFQNIFIFYDSLYNLWVKGQFWFSLWGHLPWKKWLNQTGDPQLLSSILDITSMDKFLWLLFAELQSRILT